VRLEDAVALVDERMAAGRVEHGVPCVAYGLLLDGRLVHAHGVCEDGDLRDAPDRPFRIASMSKSFTAATVLALRAEGRLALDDPVAEHLPWAQAIDRPLGGPRLTIRHLLTMTGGLPTDDPWGDRQESLPIGVFDDLVSRGLSFCRPAGAEFEYSNLGYALLGRVISQVTGEDFRDAVTSRVLEPLGMTRTTYDVGLTHDRVVGHAPRAAGLVEQPETGSGAFSPMGGLWSTVVDLARWVGALMAAETDPASSLREMQRSHVLARMEVGTADKPHSPVAASYGMGLMVNEDAERGRFVHHSGGYPGYGSHMRWHPATGWALIALGNRTYAPMAPLVAAIMDDLVADDGLTTQRQAAVRALWPQTVAAMDMAEQLLTAWDDTLVDTRAAVNLDLDQPRDERRAEWQARAEELGAVERVDDSVESRSPAHARWQVSGPGGTAWLEVLLTPELEPRIQTLTVSAVTAAGG
jgi:CubicO group peptidase (beta-lactamase class C family)